MRLQEGKYYRDGRYKIIGPMSFDPSASVYTFIAPNGDRYATNGRWDVYPEDLSNDPRDLVEEVGDLRDIPQRLSALEEQVQKLLAKSKGDDVLRISIAEDYFHEEMEKLNRDRSAAIIPMDLKEERRRAASKALDIADAFLTELENRRKEGKS